MSDTFGVQGYPKERAGRSSTSGDSPSIQSNLPLRRDGGTLYLFGVVAFRAAAIPERPSWPSLLLPNVNTRPPAHQHAAQYGAPHHESRWHYQRTMGL
eukprot:6392935-Pyramimonas_sp.AAC.2